MRERTLGLFVLILIILVSSGCGGRLGGEATPTPLPELVSYEKSIFTVERGPIISEMNVVGEIQPSKLDDLFFRSGGYVTRVTVKAGDTVKKGDILAELQVDDLLNQLEQAKIDLEVSQADLEKRKAELAYNQENVQANVIFKRNAVELAKINLQQAQGIEKSRAQIYLENAQLELELAEKSLEQISEASSVYLEQATRRSQLSVDRLQALIEERQIIAPYDGIILKATVRAGQQADGYVSAFTIGDPTNLIIRTSYNYEVASKLTPETPIIMKMQSDDKTGYPVKYLLNFVPERGVENTNQQTNLTDYIYFSFPAEVDGSSLQLGRSVFLSMTMGRKDDALLIPPAAIREYKGLRFVVVQDGDKRRRVEITEVGLKTTERWEVTADLNPGDKIVGP